MKASNTPAFVLEANNSGVFTKIDRLLKKL